MNTTYLVCCIGVSEREYFVPAFLRHFVEHYLGLGILPENFKLTIHSTSERDNIDFAREYLLRYGIRPSKTIIGEYDCHEFYRCNFEIMAALDAASWIVLVDFDELIGFPKGLPVLLEEMERNKYDLLMGELVDRVARGGQLKPIVESEPIWDQFPFCYPVTKNIVSGADGKTCAFRNYLKPTLGHHKIDNGEIANPFPTLLPVYHFKWDSSLPLKLAKRKVQFDADRARYPWHGEVNNLLAHISHDRLALP